MSDRGIPKDKLKKGDSVTVEAISAAVRAIPWLYPAAEIVHLLCLALVVGPASMWDLRLLGVSPSLPISLMARHLLPWCGIGLGLSALSGVLLFLAEPDKLFVIPALRVKLALLIVAGLNAAFFHWRGHSHERTSRAAALISLVTWASVVAAGRLIAYV